MAVVEKSFHATLKKREPAKVRVATLLIQSNDSYKGNFATIQDLQKASAFTGDYADVFETNTRWKYVDDKWVNTEQPILVNPTLATKQDIGALDERVASLEFAIENPTLLITKI
jgi:hypothetical protein